MIEYCKRKVLLITFTVHKNYEFAKKLEYDIASDIRGLRESIHLTELKNFTIALSVFVVVDNHI